MHRPTRPPAIWARARRILVPLRWDATIGLACFIFAFAFYARTVAPGVLDDDGAEFQTNIFRLGVSHTGYPLFFLLAKLWTLLVPVGNVAFRANLFSALFGALTVALIYATMRTLVASRGAAFFTALLFAFSRVEWSQSVIPRVYTLNSFFVVLIILLAALYRTGRVPLTWLVFAYGLSLTNHRTMMWFAPALGLFALVSEGSALFRPRRLLSLIVAFILPLLLYVYIPLRGDSDVGVEYHATNFTDMILAGNASVWLRFGPPGWLWDRLSAFYVPLQIEQFTPIGSAFGLLGLAAVVRKRLPRGFPTAHPPGQFLLLLAVGWLAETAFGIVFWTFDSEKYFLSSYLVFLIFTGLGLALAFDRLAQVRRAELRRILPSALAVGLVAVCGYLAWANFPRVDMSMRDDFETRWQEIFAQPLENGALLVGNWESLGPLEYYQYVENTRPDLKRDKVVIYRDQLKLAPQGDVGQELAGRLAKGTAVYLTLHPSQTETLGDLARRFELVPIASLWRVQSERLAAPASAIETRFGENLVLKSLALNAQARAGDFVPVVFNWQVAEPLDRNYKFSLRLKDAGGSVWMQREAEPLGGIQLTNKWPTGQVLRDEEGFFVPPDAPPGDYELELAVYDADSHEPLLAEGQPARSLAKLQVSAFATRLPRQALHIPHAMEESLSGATLAGYGLSDEQPRGGDTVELNTWWQGLTSAETPVQIELQDAQGSDSTVYRGAWVENSRGEFNPQQLVRARHSLTLPPSVPAGEATLRMVVNGQPVEIAHLNLRRSDRQFTPPRIAHGQIAKLGGSIEFLGYDLDQPAGQVHLTLYWHAASPVTGNYKVFVHLLDPAGVLRAQQDSPPRGGLLPTDRWFTGEYITDDYTLDLPAGLAPGDYAIEIGMYTPETGIRVPAADANGVHLPSDRVLLNTPARIGK